MSTVTSTLAGSTQSSISWSFVCFLSLSDEEEGCPSTASTGLQRGLSVCVGRGSAGSAGSAGSIKKMSPPCPGALWTVDVPTRRYVALLVSHSAVPTRRTRRVTWRCEEGGAGEGHHRHLAFNEAAEVLLCSWIQTPEERNRVELQLLLSLWRGAVFAQLDRRDPPDNVHVVNKPISRYVMRHLQSTSGQWSFEAVREERTSRLSVSEYLMTELKLVHCDA